MADVNANIGIHVDTSSSLAEIKNLQRQLAQLYTSINRGSAAAAAAQKGLATNLMNSINAGGKFYAQMGTIRTSTESFTHALEKNKLTMREYFRYAGGATRTFGRLFKSEYDTIGRVAEQRVKKMQTQYVKLGRDASGAMKAISVTPTALNMKDYGTQVAMAAQKQAILNQLLKQGSTNLLNFGKNTQWAGRQLMVGFTIPLAYFGTAAAKTFMDLEAQALKFRRVYGSMFTASGETEAALKQIQDLAQEFTKYGVAVTKTMEMAASAAAMGKTGAELTAQVAEATRLAVLGNVEQQQALETTISITNAFGIAAEDLAKKIDFLNAVENQTVVSIEDLTIAVPKAGPVVKQLGGSVEDLAFFLTAMKEGGINASEGANALKSGLASLINPTDKASKMLASMGINIKGIVEANKGDIKATVVGFAAALDTLDPLNRARAIEQLFGKFQFARLSTLFQNVTKEGTQAAKVFDLMGASVEELAILSERELKAVEDSVGVNFKEAVEKLKVTIAPIGKEFLKAITPVIEFFGKLLDKFNNLGDGTKKFIVILTTLVGLVGPTLLMTFGLLANGAANIIKLFILMRQGFLKLSGKSNVLAQQTQYLNQEQLEAATVAASLNQAHSKLTQQFTVETSAVNALRNAYVQATVAARNFAAANPGMMMPGFRGPIKGGGAKGFASGTTEVVGGIAGKDSVPALLTPGEAVVPQPIAQDERFKPLVEALVTGKIAKYETGTTGVSKRDPFSQSNLPLIKSDIPPLNPGQKGVMYFDFDGTLANTTKAIEEWKVKNNITGPTDDSTYRAFNRALMRGEVKEVEGVRSNLTRLRLARAKGYDIQVLTARENTPDNVKALKKTLGALGVNIEDSKIHLKPAGSGITDDKFKAGFLSSRSSKDVVTVLVDDRPENLQAARKIKNVKVLDAENTAVRFGDKIFNAKDAKTKKAVLNWMRENVTVNDDGSITVKGPKATRNYSSPEKAVKTIQSYLQRHPEKGFGSSMIERALSLDRGAGTARGQDSWVKTAMAQAAALDPFTELLTDKDGKPILDSKGKAQYVYKERGAIEKALKSAGLTASDADMKRLLTPHASHFIGEEYVDKDNNKVKVWRPENIGRDAAYINSYLNDRVKTLLPEIKQLPDDVLKTLGISRKDIDRFEKGMHPKTASMAKSLMGIAQYDIDRDGPTVRAVALKAGLGERFALGSYAKGVPSLRKLLPKIKIGGKTLKEIEKENLTKVAIRAGQEVRKKTTGAIIPTKAFPLTPEERSKLPFGQRLSHPMGRFMGPRSFIPGVGATADTGATGTANVSSIKAPGLTGAQVAQGYRQPLKVEVVQNPPPTPEQQRAMKAQAVSGRLMQGSMAAGGLAMVGMMSGNMELAKFAGALSAATGILSMFSSLKLMGFAAGIMLAGAAIYSWTKAMNEAKKAGVELAKSMTMTSDKLIALSKVTGKVSSVESADLKRKNILTGKSEAQRKTGQTILQSDAGKAIMASIATQSKAGGTQQTVGTNIGAQLVQAVLANAMTTEQARSFAAAIGEELNDYKLSANIEATIVNLLGPGGENLTKDPMKIALEVDKKSFKQTQDFIKYVNKEGGVLNPGQITRQDQGTQRLLSNQTSGKEKAVAAVGVGALTIAGAAIGGPLGAALGAAMGAQIADTVFDPAKSGIDKAVAVVSLGLVPAFFDIRDAQAESLKMHTAGAQLMIEELKNNQMILDSVNKQYDIQLKSAKTEKERETIEANRRKAIKAVTDQNAEQMKQLIKMKDMVGAGAFNQAILNSVQALYKEGPMKDIAETVTNALNNMENSKYKTFLQLELASGNIDPMTIKALMNNKSLRKQFDLIAKTSSDKDASTIFQLLQKAGYAAEQIEIILNTVNPDGTTATETLTEISETLANLKQTYGININVTTGGPQAAADLKTLIGALGDKQKITKKDLEVIAQTNPEFDYILESWNTLVGLDPKAVMTRTMLLNVVGMSSGDSNVVDFYLQSAGASADKATAEAFRRDSSNTAAAAAMKGVQERAAVYVAANPKAYLNYLTPGAGDGSGDKGKRDTTLDELLKRLKFVRDASINAQGGLEELLKITKGQGINKFTGVIQQLAAGPKGGFNREFISFLEGMDNATRKTYMTVKNGQVVLTKQGKALKEAFNEKVIGEYQVAQFQAVQDTKAQGAALAKLRAAGIDSATALEMVADANLAVAINSKNITTTELKNMATQAQEAKDKVRELNLELQNTVSAMTTRGQELDEATKVISKIQEVNPNVSSEFLQSLASDKTAVQGFYDFFFKGAQQNAPQLRKYIEEYFANNAAEIKLKGKIDFSQAVKTAQEAFDKAGSNVDRFLNAQRSKITMQIAPPTLMNELNRGLQVQQDKLKEAQTKLEGIKDATGKTISDYQSEIDSLRIALDAGLEIEIRKLSESIKAEQDKIAAEYDKPIEGLRNSIEKIQRNIEINFTRPIEELNDQIDSIQRDIELRFDRPIADLQEQSSDLSNDLTLMDKVIEGINKKYDDQEEALQKISDLNKDIADQQKGQLDIAGALSRGDVSAAARNAQEMRAQAAAIARQRASGVIDAARKAEVSGVRSASGMTRAQIEERQFAISQQIFQLEEQKEAQLVRVTELQDEIYGKTQLLEIEQRKIRDLEDQIYAKEVLRKAAIDALVPQQEKLTDLEKQRAVELGKIQAAEDAIAKIKNSQAYKDAAKAVSDAEKAVADAQKKLDDIEKKLRDALSKVDEQQAKWDDIKTGIDTAASGVVDFEDALNKAKTAAGNLATAMKELIIQDKDLSAADITKMGLNANANINKPGANLDEYGLDINDPDYLEKRRGKQGATSSTTTKKTTGNKSAVGTIAANLKSAEGSAVIVKEALSKIAEFSNLSAADQEKIATSILKQAEQAGLLKISQEAITESIKNQVTPSEKISSNTKNMLDSLIAAKAPADAIAEIFNSILSTANAIYQRILSWNITVTTVHNITENITRNITEYITQIIRQIVDTGPGKMYGGKIKGYMGGGKVKPFYRPMGGLIPYMANGGQAIDFKAIGSDTVPAMLTPGEFVVNKASSKAFAPFLNAINESKYPSILAKNISNARPIYQIPIQTSLSQPSYDISSPVFSASPTNIANAAYNDNSSSVYNYSVGISVGGTNASPDTIAKAVMNEIKYLDSQRVRNQKVS